MLQLIFPVAVVGIVWYSAFGPSTVATPIFRSRLTLGLRSRKSPRRPCEWETS